MAVEWWSTDSVTGDATIPGALDLLAGSGLDAAGHVIRRSLGSIAMVGDRTPGFRLPRIRYGLLVADTADGSELDPSVWNGVDWMWLRVDVMYSVLPPAGDVVGNNSLAETSSWDTDVQRTLAAGQTLWLVWDTVGPSSPVAMVRFARTLVAT